MELYNFHCIIAKKYFGNVTNSALVQTKASENFAFQTIFYYSGLGDLFEIYIVSLYGNVNRAIKLIMMLFNKS